MAKRARLFVGDIGGGDYRARVSLPGHDASDPNLSRENLHFDTSWDFLGNIHVASVVNMRPWWPSNDWNIPFEIPFPELPYVPLVYMQVGSTLLYGLNIPPRPTPPYNGNGWVLRYGGPNSGDNYPRSPENSLTYTVTNDRIKIEAVQSVGDLYSEYTIQFIVFRIPILELTSPDTGRIARLIMGKRGADTGIFISHPGYDVRTCPEEQLVLSSSRRRANITNNIQFRSQASEYFPPPENAWRLYYTMDVASGGYVPATILFAASDNTFEAVIPQYKMNVTFNAWTNSQADHWLVPYSNYSAIEYSAANNEITNNGRVRGFLISLDVPVYSP